MTDTKTPVAEAAEALASQADAETRRVERERDEIKGYLTKLRLAFCEVLGLDPNDEESDKVGDRAIDEIARLRTKLKQAEKRAREAVENQIQKHEIAVAEVERLKIEIRFKHSHLEPLYKIIEDMPDWETMEFADLIETLRDRALPIPVSERLPTEEDADDWGYVLAAKQHLWVMIPFSEVGSTWFDRWMYSPNTKSTPPAEPPTEPRPETTREG